MIADHGTTYPEALRWLDWLEYGGIRVIRCGGGHPRDLWTRPWLAHVVGEERYVVTDPDVVPSASCPPDWLEQLGRLLDANPGVPKAGMALSLDFPVHYKRRQRVLEWEPRFWVDRAAGDAYRAPVDTTLALHVPLARQPAFTFSAVRTMAPYVADHLPWHEDDTALPEDVAWYYEHAEPGISCWAPASPRR